MNIKEKIKKHILDNRNTVLCLTGGWGIGKTHLVNEVIYEISKETEDGSYVSNSVIKVSLHGVSDISDLKNRIISDENSDFYKIIEKINGSGFFYYLFKIFCKTFLLFFFSHGVYPNISFMMLNGYHYKKISSFFSNFKVNDIDVKIIKINVQNILKKNSVLFNDFYINNVSEKIFIFDDIERKSNNFELIGLIAFIEKIKKKNKIILILNDDEIDTVENKNKWNNFKDKIVDDSIKINLNNVEWLTIIKKMDFYCEKSSSLNDDTKFVLDNSISNELLMNLRISQVNISRLYNLLYDYKDNITVYNREIYVVYFSVLFKFLSYYYLSNKNLEEYYNFLTNIISSAEDEENFKDNYTNEPYYDKRMRFLLLQLVRRGNIDKDKEMQIFEFKSFLYNVTSFLYENKKDSLSENLKGFINRKINQKNKKELKIISYQILYEVNYNKFLLKEKIKYIIESVYNEDKDIINKLNEIYKNLIDINDKELEDYLIYILNINNWSIRNNMIYKNNIINSDNSYCSLESISLTDSLNKYNQNIIESLTENDLLNELINNNYEKNRNLISNIIRIYDNTNKGCYNNFREIIQKMYLKYYICDVNKENIKIGKLFKLMNEIELNK